MTHYRPRHHKPGTRPRHTRNDVLTPEKLTDAAIHALANYKEIGLVHDGDTTYWEVIKRLEMRLKENV